MSKLEDSLLLYATFAVAVAVPFVVAAVVVVATAAAAVAAAASAALLKFVCACFQDPKHLYNL